MTAPAAPVLRVRSSGTVLRARWQPVLDATDYKLYVGSATEPTGLEDDIPDDDIGSDGWFHYTFASEDPVTFVRLTALNVGAEESAYSNEVRIELSGGGTSWGKAAPPKSPQDTSDPFGAL